MTSDGGRTHLALVTLPTARAVQATHQQERTSEDVIADLDRALRDGPPDDPWRGCLFTLRRMLAAETGGPSPLRRVDQPDHPR